MEQIKKGNDLTKSLDIVNENIARLKELFPEVVTEGKIDFKVLQDILGNEIEEGEEYYRFTWAGKAQARREAHKPSTGTLRPAKDESVNWDTTQNLYIEGDNLEVLKLLQKSYVGKVKMIYIDPPYNTGNDFVYKDDYKDNLKNYKHITGQIDDEGNKLTTNSEKDGRYHSNWLNMIYPRLRLARNLLKEDGVIFISIDDNEVDNLRKVCDEIFGESNFIANIIWHKRYAASNDAKGIPAMHDYILVYQKSNLFERKLLPRTSKQDSLYKYDSNDGKGLWRPDNLTVKTVSESYLYEIINPNTGKGYLPSQGRCWLTNHEKMKEWIEEGRVFFGQKGDGAPQLKRYLSEVQNGVLPNTYWSYDEVGHTDSSRKELKKIFENSAPFDNPKPVGLLKRILQISMDNTGIVLDFFSGSATTAHAVMELNAEDNGNRRYILVQLQEKTESKSDAFKAGFFSIPEIGKERIRRTAKLISTESSQISTQLDLGFKVFKLDNSNINGWDGNPDNLEQSLFDSQDNIKTDRTEEDVLFEILLKYGLDLTLPIEEKLIEGKKVFSVGFGALFICLANNITSKVAEGIGAWKEALKPEICRVIFKDSGFGDVEKTNSVQTLKRFGINEIKSI